MSHRPAYSIERDEDGEEQVSVRGHISMEISNIPLFMTVEQQNCHSRTVDPVPIRSTKTRSHFKTLRSSG
ncbi:MAG: hypothetical protein AB7G48_00680 [Nitrospiraceae bacterium]